MATTEAKTAYIGASVERKEDARLLRGETRWVDNMTLPGMLWMAVVRSPYAHAKIGTSTSRTRSRQTASWRRSRAPSWPRNGRARSRAPGR